MGNANIVFGPAFPLGFGDHLAHGAREAGPKLGFQFFPQGEERLHPTALHVVGQGRELGGLGAWPVGLGEHVQAREGQGLDARVGVFKSRLGFRRETHQDVRGQTAVRQVAANEFHPLPVFFKDVPPAHVL